MRIESNIIFDGQTVSKSFDADIEMEFKKSKLLYNIGRKFNFLCPEPVHINSDDGRIEFKKIAGSQSIRSDYVSFMTARGDQSEDIPEIFERAGWILGVIHRELSLSGRRIWQPGDVFAAAMRKAGCADFETRMEALPHAFLHCDYGMENIERTGSPGDVKLAIFDASPNYFTTFHAHTFGPVYVDIGNFLSALYGLISLKYYPFFKWSRVAKLQSAFLHGYGESSDMECDPALIRAFSHASASTYLHHKYRKAYLHNLAMWVLFNKMKRLKL